MCHYSHYIRVDDVMVSGTIRLTAPAVVCEHLACQWASDYTLPAPDVQFLRDVRERSVLSFAGLPGRQLYRLREAGSLAAEWKISDLPVWLIWRQRPRQAKLFIRFRDYIEQCWEIRPQRQVSHGRSVKPF